MDNLEIAKKAIKLKNIIPGEKHGFFINPCPFCGHNDHFVINEKENYYISYSNCCKGGTIVDWFMEKEQLTIGQAIKKCLSYIKVEANNYLHVPRYKDKKDKKEIMLINKSYNRLTGLYRALIQIENKDAFLLFLMHFIDDYTNFFIEAKGHQDRVKLIYSFKNEFKLRYDNFLKSEKIINERMIQQHDEKN